MPFPSATPFGSSLQKKIAVLGGGLTGLVAAYRLNRLGCRVRLFEQSPRVGGAIRTELAEGWMIEAGPHSLQESEAEVTAMLSELGLDVERVEANPAAKNRYIAHGSRLVPLPLSPGALFGSPLFSFGTKLRLAAEICRRHPGPSPDCSVAALARKHFGQEVLDYAVQPFVSGIYAGDAEKISVRAGFPRLWAMMQSHGSLLRAQIAAARARRARGEPGAPKLISFRRGLQALPEALAAQLPAGTLSVNARVEAVSPGNPWQVVWSNVRVTHTERFDAVVSALPAPALAKLSIGASGERPLASLGEIVHAPISSLFLGFKREAVPHPLDGFGALVPACEKRSILGVIFSSTLFPQRAPEGHVAITVLLGGALRPEIAALPPGELLATARNDLRDLLGITAAPVFQRHTFWPQSIPQYDLGHERQVEAMVACEQANRGFFVGGQARDGISLPSCLAAGERLAARAVKA